MLKLLRPMMVPRRAMRSIGGAPEGIRTPDLCLRRETLYPAELRALKFLLSESCDSQTIYIRKER